MENKIDLHMHSFYSEDGEFSPKELVDQCAALGIQTMSITDHNCVRANLEGARFAAAKGMKYIPGVELDCTFEGVNLHVLGYDIDFQSEDFYRIEQNIENQSFEASRKRLLAFQELGYHVTENDLAALEKEHYWKGRWTGEMFAEILLSRPEYMQDKKLLPYREGGSRSDNPYVNFYWDFCSQGKICYAPIEFPSLQEVEKLIHHIDGIAVLAHPGENLKNHKALLQPILDTGLDGIEVFSSYHSEEDILYYNEAAEQRKLIITCGSDYHGKIKPAITLGNQTITKNLTDNINKWFNR